MARTKISEFSSTAASNTDIDGINIAEGCSPSGINDAIRELMSQLKDWQAGTSNDPYVIGSSGSLTLNQGTANGVLYLNGSKVATSGSALTFDGTNLSTSGIYISSAATGRLTKSNSSGRNVFTGGITGGTTDGAYVLVEGYDYGGTAAGGAINLVTAGSSSPINFLINGSEQMRLTSTGLGIGTSSPSTKLTVAAASPTIRLSDTTTSVTGGVFGTIDWQSADGSMPGGLAAKIDAYDDSGAYGDRGAIRFFTNNASSLGERMRLDSSGNLGLGVTPSAWASTAIQVGGYASLTTNTSLGAAELSSNAYRSSGSTWNYISSNYASRYRQYDSTHAWFTAPSGTAGNAISFTQAMTLDASGKLGIGTTSPSEILTVQGAPTTYGDARFNASLFDTTSATTGTGSGIAFSGYTNGTSTGATFAQIKGIKENSTAGNVAGAFVISTQPASGTPTERARIDSSGNLLVGTTSTVSNARFVSKSSTSSASDQAFQFQNSSGSVLLTCRADGYLISLPVYNQTSASSSNVFVNVDGGLYRSTSSIKYKTNVQNATHGLTEVMQLRPVTYAGKSEVDIGKTFGGLIAEEVHAIGLTEFVQYAEDGTPDALAYGSMVSLAFKAIQELKAEFDAYKASHP